MPFASRAVTVAATCALTLPLAACGTSTPTSTPSLAAPATSAATPTSAPATTAPAAIADSLKFTATTIDGKAFDAATLAGKPAVLWFWAAWCPKCRAKAADVAAVSRDFTGKVQVVGVAGLGSGDAAMDKFAADTGITGFPNLADDTAVVWKKFGVTTQEYFVVIGADGQIVHKGPLTGAELRQRATTLAG
jgi:peroxiredoxin